MSLAEVARQLLATIIRSNIWKGSMDARDLALAPYLLAARPIRDGVEGDGSRGQWRVDFLPGMLAVGTDVGCCYIGDSLPFDRVIVVVGPIFHVLSYDILFIALLVDQR